MEKNKLYKQIKYSGYNVVDYGKYGLVMKFDDVTLHVSLSFDKSVVFFRWYDEFEEKRGTLNTYENFLDILYYIGVIKDEERDQEAKKLERRV
jgi:hypothetical protein